MNIKQQTLETLKICLVLAVCGPLWLCAEYVWAGPDESSAKADAGPGAEVVARVNGEPVTRAQFDRMAANPLTLSQAQREFGVEAPDCNELEPLAMQRLIHLRLLVQEASRRNITVTQQELDEAITALRLRFDTLKDFGVWVKEQGLNDPELFETVRTDMLAERATAALIDGVSVSEEQAQKYFEAHRDELIIGTEVRLRIIAVDNLADANEIVADLQKGVPFDRLARRKSKGLLAAKGGDTGWVDFHRLPSHLSEAAAALKTGEFCGPIQKDSDEFLIVGLQGRRPVHAKNLVEALPEIKRRLLPAMQQQALQPWLKEQQEKSEIQVYVPKLNVSCTKGDGRQRFVKKEQEQL